MKRSLFGLFLLAFAAYAGPAMAQSFDCRKAFFSDERTICRSPQLARLDSQLAAVFGRAIGATAPDQRATLTHQETEWVISRRRCNSSNACIAQSYRERIDALSGRIAAEARRGRFRGEQTVQVFPPPPPQATPALKRGSPETEAAGSQAQSATSGNHYFTVEPEVAPTGGDGSGGGK